MAEFTNKYVMFEDLRKELLALTNLRNQVFENDDAIGRIFAPVLKTKGPTRKDLDKAISEFEAKVPGFYLWFSPAERQYGLYPYPEASKE